MRSDLKLLAVSALLLAAIAAPVSAQETLPEGPGMPETVKACRGCHSVDIFRNIRRSDVIWEVTINNMIGFGMTISDAEFDTVLTYLTTYLGPTPPPAQPAPPAR